jgi:hypothetical protein
MEKTLNRHLTKEDTPIESELIKRCLISYSIRERQVDEYQNNQIPNPDRTECWQGCDPQELLLRAGGEADGAAMLEGSLSVSSLTRPSHSFLFTQRN